MGSEGFDFGQALRVAGRYLQKSKSQELLLRTSALVLIYLLAFSIRLVIQSAFVLAS
jgi:hypothetical protein